MPALGTTSFAFRYQLLDSAQAPSIVDLVRQTRGYGLSRLQICENARPLAEPLGNWRSIARVGDAEGVELEIGCMIERAEDLSGYLDRAEALDSRIVRVVFEMPGGRSPGRETVVSLLEQVVPVLERRDAVIAVENHFAISCADLASWCAPFPADRVGFCLDTANSLRRFETIEMVLDRLLDRALCYHVKDWRLVGSNVGFRVEGAYLGEGDLPLDPLLRRLFRRESAPRIYLENWPPATGSRRIDIETDDRFMRKSIAAMRAALDRCCPTAPARVANLGSETAS